ncbi:MAG: helix-turn-helix domain-containing protein [Acidobacteriota bacterium]|nr:helix-turn-helix domain-containing protein [Acidobacteriota bacterium]
MDLSREACHRIFQTRDPRYDGRIFVGVRTTGIYCRPVCPARTPKLENCIYYLSAAAAQEAGFRPCLRCRPEVSPDLASWRGTSNTVLRGLDLIAEGALDGDENTVDGLAARLGVGERQLRRLFVQHLGASPVAVAQTRRLLFAKQLLHDTRLPMAEIALAAGFGSIRRFNHAFRALYNRPPRELRRTLKEDLPITAQDAVLLRICYRPPYDWGSLLKFFAARAIEGVELVENSSYKRTVEYEGGCGVLQVTNHPARNQLIVSVRFACVRALSGIVRRVRRLFDTGADIEAISRHLSNDPFLAPLIARRPGLRTAGGWDGFEVAVRAILGQQITVQAARRLAGRLTAAFGKPLGSEISRDQRLSHIFPTAHELANSDLTSFGIPRSRAAALSALASAAVSDPRLFTRGQSMEEAVARFRALQGVGEWTAQYIALRALRETDAFPASDLGLLQGIASEFGRRPEPGELLQRAESWRPWRAYAAQHLWANHLGANQGDVAVSKQIEKESNHATGTKLFHRQDRHTYRPDVDSR